MVRLIVRGAVGAAGWVGAVWRGAVVARVRVVLRCGVVVLTAERTTGQVTSSLRTNWRNSSVTGSRVAGALPICWKYLSTAARDPFPQIPSTRVV